MGSNIFSCHLFNCLGSICIYKNEGHVCHFLEVHELGIMIKGDLSELSCHQSTKTHWLIAYIVQDTYIKSRAETMQNIEQTIVELGEIFQQLAHMVKEQEEMVGR